MKFYILEILYPYGRVKEERGKGKEEREREKEKGKERERKKGREIVGGREENDKCIQTKRKSME